MRDLNSEPYDDDELAEIQVVAERIQTHQQPRETKAAPTRKEKRTAVRAQAKRNRAQILTTIPDQGPGIWLEEAKRKRENNG